MSVRIQCSKCQKRYLMSDQSSETRILLAIGVPSYMAMESLRRFKMRDIERADAREMVVYVESAYPLERTVYSENRQRTVTIGYEIRTTEFGHSRVSAEIYRKLFSNRRVLAIASTVHGFKIHKVIRTARHGEDFQDSTHVRH